MKSIKNIFSILLAGMTAFGIASCSDDVEYTPAEKPTNAQVFFPSSMASTIDLAEDASSFTVELCRAEASAAATVALNVSDETGKLSIPTSVEFASGASSAFLTIGYTAADFEYDIYQNVTITVAEADATPYGISSYSFSVGVPAPWTEWEVFGTGTYTFAQYYSGTHSGLNLYMRSYKLDPNIHEIRFEGLADAYSFTAQYNSATGKLVIPQQHILDHSSYGPLYIASSHVYWHDVRGDADATEETEGASTLDLETGLITLNVCYFVGAGYFGDGEEYFQLDGYEQPDYTFALTEAGHYLDPAGVDHMVFHVQKGADIAEYKYIALQGKLNDTQASVVAAKIMSGEVEAEIGTESGYISFAFPEMGEYSVVAIAFDAEGQMQGADYVAFEYIPVGQDDPWQSLGMCAYTDDVVMPMYTEEGSTCTYEVEIQERTDKPGLFRLVNPYGEAFPFYQYAVAYPDKDVYVEIDARDPNAVTIAYQSVGLDLGDGELGIYSAAAYYLDNGYTAEEVAAAGLFGTYADGVITFPVDVLYLALGSKLYYGNMNGEFKVDMTNMAAAASTRSAFVETFNKFKGNFAAKAPAKKIKSTVIDVNDFTTKRQNTVK